MKALITGAHGFLGRHVARTLAGAGYTVVGIGHGSWDQNEFSRFKLSFWHSTDVTLDALVTYAGEPDVIVHCAGGGSVAFSMSHPYQDYLRTVGSTAAVLEYIRLHSPSTVLVYPSSAAVYGIVEDLPIREANRTAPASPYGMHKLIAEHLCQSYAAHYGVALATIRFFSIFGEGLRKQLLWDACNKIARGEKVFAGTGEELRDWLHVEDAAGLVRMAAEHASPANPIVNGGAGAGISVKDVLLEVFRAFGSNQVPQFSGVRRPGDPPGHEADISAATEWGWVPKLGWKEGVHRYVQWFKGLAT